MPSCGHGGLSTDGNQMKTISLLQPWCTLLCVGAKKIETRSWSTNHRGEIAIHASIGNTKKINQLLTEPPFGGAMRNIFGAKAYFEKGVELLPRGAVIATARITACYSTVDEEFNEGVFDYYPDLDTPLERAFGDFSPGRFGWVITNVKLLPKPIPVKGKLGLWEWDGAA